MRLCGVQAGETMIRELKQSERTEDIWMKLKPGDACLVQLAGEKYATAKVVRVHPGDPMRGVDVELEEPHPLFTRGIDDDGTPKRVTDITVPGFTVQGG